MQDHSIALDPHATRIIIGPGRAMSAAELAAMTTEVIDRRLIPALPGVDTASAHHRHRRPQPQRCPRWLAVVGRALSRMLPLAVGLVAVVCLALFLGVVNP